MTDQYTELRQALEYLDSFCDPLSAAYEDASSRAQGLSAHFAPSLLAERDRLREALGLIQPLAAAWAASYAVDNGLTSEHPQHKAALDAAREALKEQQ